MSHCVRMLCLLVFAGSLVACGEKKPVQPRPISCASIRIGRPIGEQPVHGFIFGGVGRKIELRDCHGVLLHFAFIGDEPAEYRRLAERAVKQGQVLGFSAVADGFVVDESRGIADPGRRTSFEDYVVLLDGLEGLREDPSVAANFDKLRHDR